MKRPADIFIPASKLKNGRTGDKAVVKVVEWPGNSRNPIGHVVDILGQSGDNTTEIYTQAYTLSLHDALPIC